MLSALVAMVPTRIRAASAADQTGAQLLQAQLPGGTTVSEADCEQLARAVTLATLSHRTDAKPILTAALTRNAKKDSRSPEAKLPCACVTRLLRASIGAAPDKASALLELASSLNPECADSLEAAVQVLNDHNAIDYKNVIDDKNGPVTGQTPASGSQPYSNAPDLFDPGFETSGFGVGFGPGFPGSPGFTGSPPSGAIALPPIANPVTDVQNG